MKWCDVFLVVPVQDEGVAGLGYVTHGFHLDGLGRARFDAILIGVKLANDK